MAAYQAFLNPDIADGGTSFESGRQARYTRNWNYYNNESYQRITEHLDQYPGKLRLYKFTRGILNPVHRHAEFYVSNIWGGPLDLKAGDGTDPEAPTSIPILTENERIRPGIAKLWQDSNFATRRILTTRYGASTGDCVLKIVDRPAVGKVYMQALWPGYLTECIWDDFGNVKRAVLEYKKADPAEPGKLVNYKEVIEHPSYHGDGSFTHFETFKDNRPYAFYLDANGQPVQSWTVPYDFVPLVTIPNIDTGTGWGSTGFAHVQWKIDEANAIASQLSDQVSKGLNTPIASFGTKAGDIKLDAEPGQVPILHIPNTEAHIEKLIYDLDIPGALTLLDRVLGEISEDLPELRFREAVRSGMSGEALGRTFADVFALVRQVRGNYDSGLVRAQNMALAIGGIRGYGEEFAGFSLDSYAKGDLNHSIGDRPVLPLTEGEQLDIEMKRQRVRSGENALQNDRRYLDAPAPIQDRLKAGGQGAV